MATDGLRIFSGSSHPQLAKEICECLNISPGRVHTVRFSNENLKVKIDENVREQDVFVVQTSCPPLSEDIIEIFFVIRQGDNYGILNPIGILPEGDKETRMSDKQPKSSQSNLIALDSARQFGARWSDHPLHRDNQSLSTLTAHNFRIWFSQRSVQAVLAIPPEPF